MKKTRARAVMQARTLDEIKPLVELCRAGKLFEAQEWITAGGPVDPPPCQRGKVPHSPLEVAVDRGFHSLVRLLLEAGASFERKGRCRALSWALRDRRGDIVRLLVEHGYDPATVNMREVFETWDAELMEYFVDRGADLESGNSLAHALCARIQTALRVLKRYGEQRPHLRRQADAALRYHCKEGNLKWVSLMLWAGADPHAGGPSDPEWDLHEEQGGLSALAYAALYQRYEVFGLKHVRLEVNSPSTVEVLRYARGPIGVALLKRLLEAGMSANDQANGGSSLIQNALEGMCWGARFARHRTGLDRGLLDSPAVKERVDVIELLAEQGGRWVPKGDWEVKNARRSLLQVAPRFTLAFFTVMSAHRACSRGHIKRLVVSASMKRHLGPHADLIVKFLPSFADGMPPNGTLGA